MFARWRMYLFVSPLPLTDEKDINRNGLNQGIGKPEPLRDRRGYWSRRIDETNRIVYKVEEDSIVIATVRGHYDE